MIAKCLSYGEYFYFKWNHKIEELFYDFNIEYEETYDSGKRLIKVDMDYIGVALNVLTSTETFLSVEVV